MTESPSKGDEKRGQRRDGYPSMRVTGVWLVTSVTSSSSLSVPPPPPPTNQSNHDLLCDITEHSGIVGIHPPMTSMLQSRHGGKGAVGKVLKPVGGEVLDGPVEKGEAGMVDLLQKGPDPPPSCRDDI